MYTWLPIFLILVVLTTGIAAQTVSLTYNGVQTLAPSTSIYFTDVAGIPNLDISAVANSSKLILETPGNYYIFCNVTGTPIQNLGGVFNGVTVPLFASAGPYPYAYVGRTITNVPTVLTIINLSPSSLQVTGIVFEITTL